MRQNKKKQSNEIIKGISLLSQIGFMVAACILTGVLLGRFLDGVFNTSPWLVLLFSLLGTGAAFKYLMEFTKRM